MIFIDIYTVSDIKSKLLIMESNLFTFALRITIKPLEIKG